MDILGKDPTVSPERKTSIATGTLFIIATIAALAAAELQPVLTGDDYLTGVAQQDQRLAIAAICYLIAAGTSVGIAIALHPLLAKVDAALALGSVVFRAIEAVFYTVAVVGLLAVLTLARQLGTAPAESRPAIRAIADNLVGVRDHATLVGVIAFSVGALMYYGLLYRSRLIPRWLSGWGVAATLLMLFACVLALFAGRPVTGYAFLILPILVQEMVLACWLLVKGFSPSVTTDAPSETGRSSSVAIG